MARPRIFISSTFYDLQHIRTSLEGFVERMGYEAVLSEKGRIAYDPDIPLDVSCYRESASCDIFVLIIGGRYGSAASDEDIANQPDFYERYQSITKKEYDSACNRDIPVYILVERTVFSEYETYKKNKDNETIEYAHVDSINIFHLLEEILGKSRNNPIYQFGRHTEIEEWLREQWAGLFRELINRRSEQKQLSSLSDKISELSSINSSLQRYMETVVTSVKPKEAGKIIAEETERLKKEKNLREFHNIPVVEELSSLFNIQQTKIEEIYKKASSIEDLAKRVELESGGVSADTAINHWRKNPHIVNDINKARSLLGMPKLEWWNYEMDKLVTSSPTTLRWLSTIKAKVKENNLSFKYSEAKYYASFWSPKTKRNIAYLHPQKTQIRLFTRLAPSFNSALQTTPSSSKWADMYPSIFIVSSEDSINKAIEFIISSYEKDSREY